MFHIFGHNANGGMIQELLADFLHTISGNKSILNLSKALLTLGLSLFLTVQLSAQCKPNGSSCNLTSIGSALTPTSTFLGCSADSCSLYYLFPTSVTADSAESWANSVGGHLASIQSAAENDSITKWAAQAGVSGSVWIGLNDKNQEGRFVWTDGTDTTFKSWKAGRPNGVDTLDDCVQLFVTGADSGKWNDTNCALTLPAIIRISLCMNVSVENDTICNNDTAFVSSSVQGGSPNYTYAWSNSSTNDSLIVSPATSGGYALTVTDRYSCTGTDSVYIQVDTLPTFSLGGTDTICADSLYVMDAGAGTYSYLWSSGKTTQRDTVIFAGTYWGRRTDSNGCSFTDTFRLAVDTIPVFDLGNDSTVCAGDTVVVKPDNIKSTYSYKWDDNSTDTTFKIWQTDTAELTVTDLNGCSSNRSRIIRMVNNPVVNIGNDTSVCAQSIFNINGPVGFNYHQWIIHQDTFVNASVQADTNGSYYFYGRDTNDCPGYDTLVVIWDTIPQINLGNDTSICQFDTITLSVGPGYANISWSTGDTTRTAKASLPQAYNVQVTDSNGCNGFAVIQIANDTLPEVEIRRNGFSGDTTFCTSDSVFLHNLSTIDSMEYSWNGGAFVKGNDTLIAKTAGQYILELRDTNTCMNRDTINLALDTLPVVGLRGDTTICHGDSILLTSNPDTNYNHVWNNMSLGKQDTLWVKDDSTYTLPLIDRNTSCRLTDSVSISHDTLPVINLGVDTGFCQGDTVTLDAGPNYLSYQWSSGANDTNQTLKVATKGSYKVSVVDQNLCKGSDTRFVDRFILPIPNLGPDKEFCAGSTVNEELDPGAGYNFYKWSHGPQGDSTLARKVTVTAQGTYSVTVTDSNGCVGADTISINANFLPTIDLGPDTSFCEGDKFNFLIDAGAGFVQYEWFDASGGAPIKLPTTGQILLVQDKAAVIICRITDNNGCQNSDTLEIIELTRPTVNFIPTKYCEGNKRFFSEVVDAGAGYTKYRWSTGDSTQTITVTESGDYVVTVTSPNTCTGEGTKKVIEIPQPNIDWTADSIICKGNTVTLNAGKTGYVHYWWYEVTETNGIQDTTMINPMIQPGDTLPDTTITSMEITKEGRFKVYTRYFEAPFCFDSAETFIREDLYPEIDFGIQRPDTTLCVGETLLLDPNFTGSSSRQVIYEWQDDSEDSIYYARETGLYTLSMTNDCGADIDEVYVTFDDCSNIYIPNTFSPNGDGDNELWGISSLQKFIEFNLEIFDRDGHVIWETNDSKILWDGTHIRSGEPLPIGLYVYKISYRSWFEYIEGVNSAPTRELTGAIHLIR